MTDEELADIEERHRAYPISTASTALQVCPKDLEGPCETMRLVADIKRQREQLRIAEDVLGQIASCGCTKCPPQPRDIVDARLMADHALTRMSVVE